MDEVRMLSPVLVILIQARMRFITHALLSEKQFAASVAATPKKPAALSQF